MQNLGYSTALGSFLTKNFGQVEINITRRKNIIESIVGYQDNESIKIPEDILVQVKNDIQQSL